MKSTTSTGEKSIQGTMQHTHETKRTPTEAKA